MLERIKNVIGKIGQLIDKWTFRVIDVFLAITFVTVVFFFCFTVLFFVYFLFTHYVPL